VGHKATRERTEPMSQEADTTVPDENDDNLEEDDLFGDKEQSEEDELEAGLESDIGENEDEAEAGKEVEELDDDFEGEDGEEPWGIDEYTAEGYAPP
jgi:hypothetical protein